MMSGVPHRWLPALLAIAVACSASAGPIIKFVDEAGNVTYSDRPPGQAASSEEMQLDAGPSEADVQQARKRLEQTKQVNQEMEQARKDLARERETQRQQQTQPVSPTVIIQEPAGYPTYQSPPGHGWPGGKPPGFSGDHPAYRPGRPPPQPRLYTR